MILNMKYYIIWICHALIMHFIRHCHLGGLQFYIPAATELYMTASAHMNETVRAQLYQKVGFWHHRVYSFSILLDITKFINFHSYQGYTSSSIFYLFNTTEYCHFSSYRFLSKGDYSWVNKYWSWVIRP